MKDPPAPLKIPKVQKNAGTFLIKALLALEWLEGGEEETDVLRRIGGSQPLILIYLS